MKSILLLCFAAPLTSCGKTDEKPSGIDSYWKLGTTSFKPATVDLSNRWAIHAPAGKDSLQLSAHLTEQ